MVGRHRQLADHGTFSTGDDEQHLTLSLAHESIFWVFTPAVGVWLVNPPTAPGEQPSTMPDPARERVWLPSQEEQRCWKRLLAYHRVLPDLVFGDSVPLLPL